MFVALSFVCCGHVLICASLCPTHQNTHEISQQSTGEPDFATFVPDAKRMKSVLRVRVCACRIHNQPHCMPALKRVKTGTSYRVCPARRCYILHARTADYLRQLTRVHVCGCEPPSPLYEINSLTLCSDSRAPAYSRTDYHPHPLILYGNTHLDNLSPSCALSFGHPPIDYYANACVHVRLLSPRLACSCQPLHFLLWRFASQSCALIFGGALVISPILSRVPGF